MPTCKICKEGITTTPLCPSCVKEEMATWLAESQPEMIAKLEMESEDYMRNFGSAICVKCSKHMDTCSHCFIKHIANWLGDFADDGTLLREYETYFNSPIIDNYGVYEIRPL